MFSSSPFTLTPYSISHSLYILSRVLPNHSLFFSCTPFLLHLTHFMLQHSVFSHIHLVFSLQCDIRQSTVMHPVPEPLYISFSDVHCTLSPSSATSSTSARQWPHSWPTSLSACLTHHLLPVCLPTFHGHPAGQFVHVPPYLLYAGARLWVSSWHTSFLPSFDPASFSLLSVC